MRHAIKARHTFHMTPHPIGSVVCVTDSWVEGTDWLEADGRLLLKRDYPDLYRILTGPDGRAMFGQIGFGNKFNIPDLRE